MSNEVYIQFKKLREKHTPKHLATFLTISIPTIYCYGALTKKSFNDRCSLETARQITELYGTLLPERKVNAPEE